MIMTMVEQQGEKKRALPVTDLEQSPSAVQTLEGSETVITADDMTDLFIEDVIADGEGDRLLETAELTGPSESDLETIETDFSETSIELGSSLNQYLREIGRVPLLSAEEEIRLARILRRGQDEKQRASRLEVSPDQRVTAQARDAQSRLTEANLRLVVSIARKYQNRGLTLLDLIQEGNNGLIIAVDKFNPDRGFKFSTYATWWIRQFVLRAIANQARTIRLPVHMVDTINRVVKVSSRLSQELGREPDATEIAQQMGTSADSVREILRASQQPISLETPVGEDGDTALGDFVEDAFAPSPTDVTVQHQLKERVADALSCLSERERMVLQLRFGLLDGQSRTLAEVGQILQVTRERARQIEVKALHKLRTKSGYQLKDFLS